MGLGDHLEDLRRRVLRALIVPLPLAILIFFIADWLLEVLILPLQRVQLAGGWTPQLQVLSPPEFLLLEMKLSIVAALALSLPWIMWQGWRFIAPGLYPHERRYVHLLVPGSFLLVVAGLSLLYFVMLPLMLQVLMLFASGIETPAVLLPAATESASVISATFPVGRPETATVGQAWLAEGGRFIEVAVAATIEGHVQLLSVPLMLQVLMLFASGIETPAVLLPAATESASVISATFPVGRPEAATVGQAWLAEGGRFIEVAVAATIEGHVQLLSVPLDGQNAISQVFRLSSYIDFVLALSLGIAAAFQLPLAVLLLSWIGVVNVETLRKRRNWALLICAVVAAITTPSDVFSMLIMLIPLYLLYELGILLAVWIPASRMSDADAEA